MSIYKKNYKKKKTLQEIGHPGMFWSFLSALKADLHNTTFA
jgi:hypothetical protein